MYSLNAVEEIDAKSNNFKSYRFMFEQFKKEGLNFINPKACFCKQLVHDKIVILKDKDVYKNNAHGAYTCEDYGRAITLNTDYGSGSAGISLVNRPMCYKSGVYFYEFHIHKSGQYDNLLCGVILTELVDVDSMRDSKQYDKFSERFTIQETSFDFKFHDYFGSAGSYSYGLYQEGNAIYHKGSSSSVTTKAELRYREKDPNALYVVGVYLDTNKMRLAFALDGVFSSSGFDLSGIETNHPQFMSGQLAFYPGLSLGHLWDAASFETKFSLHQTREIKRIAEQISYK